MTPLPELLARAAGGEPVGFGPDDVRRRYERRTARHRAGAVAALLVVAALVAGALARAAGEDTSARADPTGRGPLTASELEGGPWVLTATSRVTVGGVGTAFLAFDEGGGLHGSDGCRALSGSWDLDGGRLAPAEVVTAPSRSCPADVGLAAVLAGGPAVGRFDGRPGSLELRTSAGFVAFERADRIGRAATSGDLVGTWSADGTAVTFGADGTVAAGCAAGTWALGGEGLDVRLRSGGTGACAGPAPAVGGRSRPRVVGPTLVLAGAATATTLTRDPGAEGDPTVARPGEGADGLAERVAADLFHDPATTVEVAGGEVTTVTLEAASGSTLVAVVAPDEDEGLRLLSVASPGFGFTDDGPSVLAPAPGLLTLTTYGAGLTDPVPVLATPVAEGRLALPDVPAGAWVAARLETDAGPVLHQLVPPV